MNCRAAVTVSATFLDVSQAAYSGSSCRRATLRMLVSRPRSVWSLSSPGAPAAVSAASAAIAEARGSVSACTRHSLVCAAKVATAGRSGVAKLLPCHQKPRPRIASTRVAIARQSEAKRGTPMRSCPSPTW